MLEISLFIDNKEKKFKNKTIETKLLKKTLRMQEMIETQNLSVDSVDEIEQFLVEIYNNQFTKEELEDGLPLENFMKKTIEDMDTIIRTVWGKVEEISKN